MAEVRYIQMLWTQGPVILFCVTTGHLKQNWIICASETACIGGHIIRWSNTVPYWSSGNSRLISTNKVSNFFG